VDGRVYGLAEARFRQLFEQTEVLVNLTGATVLRDEHLHIPIRIYLETDPVVPQIEVAQGNQFTIDLLRAHTHHFTYGENLGAPDCAVPSTSFAYQPTRQPIVLEWWNTQAQPAQTEPTHSRTLRFTTIANWQQSGKDI
jgi:hypothetical protein